MSFFCQKKYLIEFDRINNTEKYFELIYEKGKYNEILIKKPSLKKGDMVRFKGVNLNPFVFQMNITKPAVTKKGSVGGNAIAGLSGILSNMDDINRDVLYQLNRLDYYRPDLPQQTRGEASLSAEEMILMESKLKIFNFHTTLITAYKSLKAYQDASKVIYSKGLTKIEIIDKLKSSIAENSTSDLGTQIRKIKQDFSTLKNDPIISAAQLINLEDAYKVLIKEIDSSILSPMNANDLISTVEKVEFIQESTIIFGYNPDSYSEKFDLVNTEGTIDYSIEFNALNSDSRQPNDYHDGLMQNHTIHLPIQTPGGFEWATGLYGIGVIGGISKFILNSDYDSIKITEEKTSPGFLTLGSSLLYNFPSSKSIIPHLLIGMSIGFGKKDVYPLNFLIGGGIKFKKFPFIGISSGLAFCENKKINNGLELNKNYSINENIVNEDNFYRRIYSPGLFVGININL